MRAEIGRQDRPGHVGEAAREERRGQLDDVMLRLEPGDVARIALAADFAEADEGVHLVLVATHGLRHRRDPRHVGIGRDVEQIVMAAQPPQQAIENGKAFGIAVQDRELRQLDEFGGYAEGAGSCRAAVFAALSGGGSSRSGLLPRTVQVTSDGFITFSTSARAALRQPSKSVSLSRVMRYIAA